MTTYKNTEEVKAKAAALTTKLGCKIHPFTFTSLDDKKELIAGFVKEPARMVKARAMDKVKQGNASFAYAELLEVCLLKDESDPRIISELSENDPYNLGACEFCGGLLLIALDQTDAKKK